MIKSVLTYCRVVACLLLPTFFNSALALDAPPHDTLTYTLELKPIPYEAFNLARVTFLPEVKDSEFGFSGNELDGDYNHNNGGGDCSKKDNLYTPANCLYPYELVLSSQCAFLPGYYAQCKCLSKFNKTSCDAPYILGGESCDGKYEKCVCPAKVELTCPNDTCTKTCDGNCITKSCTPTANQTGCTNGTQACDDGCCGTSRRCCIPCTDKITSKPNNSSYTYETCTDASGSHQIQSGWICNNDYHQDGNACVKNCTPLSDETNCSYATKSCSDGCGGTRTCCVARPCNVSGCSRCKEDDSNTCAECRSGFRLSWGQCVVDTSVCLKNCSKFCTDYHCLDSCRARCEEMAQI